MDIFTVALLFAAGSVAGWVLEVIARFFTQEKKLVNPGFLSGPYLPIHGFGLLLLYLVSWLDISFALKVVLFVLSTTLLELATGLFLLYYYNFRLWDYSKNFMNFRGLICPLYSFAWLLLALAFYFFAYPFIPRLTAAVLSYRHSVFILGGFYGIMIIDWARSLMTAENIRLFFADMKRKHLETVRLNYDLFRERMTALLKKRHAENFLSGYLLSFKALDRRELVRQLTAFVVKKRTEFKKSIRQSKRKLKRGLVSSSEGLFYRR